VTDTSQQIPGDISGHRSNWQVGTPEGNPLSSEGNTASSAPFVCESWGDHLSNDRAFGGSPEPLVIQRRKTIK
jgi:hypothetical protein